jgi:LmbE family N-acetylglucosaminyl deacetylase
MSRTILHLAPHPDDELIGAPATLFALRDHGWRVVNLALSLGRPEQTQRRCEELTEACRRAQFDLIIPGGLTEIAHLGDGEVADEENVRRLIADAIEAVRPDVVVSPSPHDRHPGHETVACALRDVLAGMTVGEGAPRWWMWGIWADLPLPTLFTPFDEDRLSGIMDCLSAHAGELQRNPYDRMVRGRGIANAVLGPERVFGFGVSAEVDAPYGELLTEVQPHAGPVWWLGLPRVLDVADALPEVSGVDAGWWVEAESVTRRAGRPGLQRT